MKKLKPSSSRSQRKSSKTRSPREGFGFVEDKRARYLSGVDHIDYKDHELLKKFMTEHGKIMPRRITGTSSKQQRQLKHAIRISRIVGLVR